MSFGRPHCFARSSWRSCRTTSRWRGTTGRGISSGWSGSSESVSRSSMVSGFPLMLTCSYSQAGCDSRGSRSGRERYGWCRRPNLHPSGMFIYRSPPSWYTDRDAYSCHRRHAMGSRVWCTVKFRTGTRTFKRLSVLWRSSRNCLTTWV